MDYVFENNIPIYIQIMDILILEILSKKNLPGQKILSIREYSEKFHVTPNTVQKALTNLEKDGFIYTERTNGKFITKDMQVIDTMRTRMAKKNTINFLNDMLSMGYTKEEIKNLIDEESCENEQFK